MRAAIITAVGTLGLVLLGACAAPPSAAAGASVCMARVQMLAELKDRHGEQPVAMGVSNYGELVEIVVAEGGDWTILITEPNGPTCAVAAGEEWHQAPEPEGPGT